MSEFKLEEHIKNFSVPIMAGQYPQDKYGIVDFYNTFLYEKGISRDIRHFLASELTAMRLEIERLQLELTKFERVRGMSIDTINSYFNDRNESIITTFTMYGRTFNIEANVHIPEEHLQGYIKSHISNLVWKEVFERPITELSQMIAFENLKRRDDLH